MVLVFEYGNVRKFRFYRIGDGDSRCLVLSVLAHVDGHGAHRVGDIDQGIGKGDVHRGACYLGGGRQRE